MPEANPTARALACLEAISDTPGITALALGRRLGVSERAVRRYVATLRAAGVPVTSTRGPYGGFRLGRGVQAPLRFSAAEALGLIMAVLDGHHAAGDDDTPVGRALGKLVRVLPEPVAGQVETVRRTTAPAPDRAAARPDPDVLAPVATACAERQQVRLAYRAESGRESEMVLDPWAVVVRHGRWYVVGWSHGPGAVRALRVDRVAAVETRPATFAAPAGLDPVALLEDHLAVGWEHRVDVRIEAPAAAVRPWLPPALGRVTPDGDDRCRLRASTSNPAWYAEQLAAVRAPYTVVGGPELRAAVGALADRLAAAVRPPAG